MTSSTHAPTVTATPHPFERFRLSPALIRAVVEAGYLEPRPIQAEAIPAVLEGRDVLGLAQTGTGKTAAFALPILERILARGAAAPPAPAAIPGHRPAQGHGPSPVRQHASRHPAADARHQQGPHHGRRAPGPAQGAHGHAAQSAPRRAPQALILAPTRELAIQIAEDFADFSRHTRIQTTLVYGGVSERPQIDALRRGPEIVIACPGRLLDLLQRNLVRLDAIETLVLDEADHMFDMGFLPDVRRILAALPARRQNLLFSATMPPEIRQLADQLLRDPFVAELTHSAPPATIEHALYPVPETRKIDLLDHLLGASDFVSAIVFTRTKHRAKRLALRLAKSGHHAVALQGNMSQNQRDKAMQGFRAGKYDVLVATDIVARGIDIEQVSHVINFDMPNTPEAYTHRIGRTGRAERAGKACTFTTGEDREMVRAIERKLGKPIPRVKTPGFEDAGATSHASGENPWAREPRQSSHRRRPPTRTFSEAHHRSPAAGPGRAPHTGHASHPRHRSGPQGGHPAHAGHASVASRPQGDTSGPPRGESQGGGTQERSRPSRFHGGKRRHRMRRR